MLHIYKASAGSGKTHLLTGFFLKLLLKQQSEASNEQQRPLLFNEVLAVTFTNKATAEMKERFIKELHQLATDPEKSDHYEDLIKPGAEGEKPLTPQQISRRARAILNSVLNSYTDLHVSTIDSFFQHILRSFAHELNLLGNYEIELDSNTILDHAVSQFITELDPQKDPETFQWIIDFNSQQISEGEHWNIHKALLKLAGELTKEEYKLNSKAIELFTRDRSQLRAYIKRMYEMQRQWRQDLMDIGKEAMKLLQEAGLQTSDFSNGQRTQFNCLPKWAKGEFDEPKKTLREYCDDTTKWFAKGSVKRNCLSEQATNRLQELLRQGVDHITGNSLVQYESAKAVARNLFQLGLLSRLEEEVNRYCDEKGIQLLSNTTQIVNKLIDNGDSPFIYEKTGTRIHSFMIDEFQDTSTLQWENFRPLLSNSLGEGYDNLIVGDVKQSIYRWRGSDWELLNSVVPNFEPMLQARNADGNTLKYNFRSKERIISFNNNFFSWVADELAKLGPSYQKIADIYQDVRQEIHESRTQKAQGGLLHFESVEKGEDESAHDAIGRRLIQIIISLQQPPYNYQARQILILCRTNDECEFFANTLLDYRRLHPESPCNMDIITEDALSLGNRMSIRTVVFMLKYLQQPKSPLFQLLAHCHYLMAGGLSPQEALNCYFEKNEVWERRKMPNILQLANLPLFEMVEGLVAVLPKACRNDFAYLQALRDLVLEHTSRRGSDLGGFLKWWDETGKDKSVSTPATQNAMRIMTIHQSKGLGEDVVIIPLANWQFEIKTSHDKILWCKPEGTPFEVKGHSDLVLPIELNKELADTVFKEKFDDERVRAITDNFNNAYVAFTRAKEAMIIMTPAEQKKEGKTKTAKQEDSNEKKQAPTLAKLLTTFFENHEDFSDPLPEPEETEAVPAASTAAPCAPAAGTNETLPTPEGEAADLEDIAPKPQIKISDMKPHDSEMARGTTIHDALSAVKHMNDYEEPIRQLFGSGRAELEGITLDELIGKVGKLIRQPKVQAWFDPDNRVLNEQNIINYTTHTQRPDRVVITPDRKVCIIDYKTGKTHNARYVRQVQSYIRLLTQMGFTDVKGYLWYIDQNKIQQVTPQSPVAQLTLDL